MVFQRRSREGKFVAWGKDKARDESHVVEAGKYLEGLITETKESDTYGMVYTLKVKGVDDPLIITGTTILNREMGYPKNDETGEIIKDEDAVGVGDKVRIHFDGMKPSKNGKDTYQFTVEVDR